MNDKLAQATDTPSIADLALELSRCSTTGSPGSRVTNIENTRFCFWPGQSDDGKKWAALLGSDKKVFPWDGASDSRVFYADELVNSIVDLTDTAFWRAAVKVSPGDFSDVDKSSTANGLIRWLIDNQMFNELSQEVELISQYTFTYGWCAAHICWQQENGFRHQKITAEQIVQLAQRSPEGSALADLPKLILAEADDQVAEVMMAAFPHLKKARALKAVKELRETGECTFPVPTVLKNKPQIAALLPYEEFLFPPETSDLNSARVLFMRRRFTEAELRAEATVNDWPDEWVEAAAGTAGKDSATTTLSASGTTDALATENRIEVVWAYTKSVDDDGIPGIYCTVFTPLVQDSWASHELLDYEHGEYPFVIWRAEKPHRKIIESRGVPEIAQTWQNEVKVQRDSIFDYTSINTLPPLQVPKARAGQVTLGPAVQIPVLRPDEVRWMDPPAREPSVAFELIEKIEAQGDRYYGRPSEKVFPVLTQMRQQRIVNNWLHSWTTAFRQILSLALQYLSPEEIQRITASTVPLDGSTPKWDVTLKFDVRELATDLATEKMKAIAELILPLDSAGVIDRAKLVKYALRAIDAGMAEELVMQSGPAAQKMFDETNDDISLMALGNPPKLRENDPAAQIRLAFAAQIVQANPKYQQQLINDDIFKESMQKYRDNLLFSVTQQQNAITGRLGVAPQ